MESKDGLVMLVSKLIIKGRKHTSEESCPVVRNEMIFEYTFANHGYGCDRETHGTVIQQPRQQTRCPATKPTLAETVYQVRQHFWTVLLGIP